MKILAFIPARLESKRFPKKILKNIFDIPMIEHVRRRVHISKVFTRVHLVTNSKMLGKILDISKKNILITKKKHYSGSSRVSEISKKLKFDYGFIIFADEPFVDPKIFKICKKFIKKNPNVEIFNVTTNLKKNDLYSHEVVKVVVDHNNLVKDFFRKKKSISLKLRIVKSCGIFILKKKLLDKLKKLNLSVREIDTNIEQFRFLDNGYKIKSIFYKDVKSSINTINEYHKIIEEIKNDKKELKLIKQLKKIEYKKI